MLSLLAMVSKSLALLTSAGLSLKRVSSSVHGERIQRQNIPLTCLVGNLNSMCLGNATVSLESGRGWDGLGCQFNYP